MPEIAAWKSTYERGTEREERKKKKKKKEREREREGEGEGGRGSIAKFSGVRNKI